MNNEIKVIGFFHQKGGVGKSVLCNIIAQELSKAGLRIVIVDSDKQGSIYCEYSQCSLNGEQPNVEVARLLGFKDIQSFIVSNLNAFDYALIDTAGLINNDMIEVAKCCDTIIIPITASSTDWTSLQSFVSVFKNILSTDQNTIAILNKYKPNTKRWKEYLPFVQNFLLANGIKLPLMESKGSSYAVPVQLRDREDYTTIIMRPLTDEKISSQTKSEVNNLINSLLKLI